MREGIAWLHFDRLAGGGNCFFIFLFIDVDVSHYSITDSIGIIEGDRPEGWESLYYGEKQPVPVLVSRGEAALLVHLVTVIAPAADLRLDIGERIANVSADAEQFAVSF